MTSDRFDEATEILPAPVERVFATFCNADLVADWLPPEGMTGTVHRWVVEPGEPYRMTLWFMGEDAPEGKAGGGKDEVVGRFVEVRAPELVIQEAQFPSDDPANSGTMRMEWTFRADGDRTRAGVRATSVPASIAPEVHREALHDTLRQLGKAAARD